MPQSQTYNVPLLSLNEAEPTSGAPAGRLKAINNAIAQRWKSEALGTSLKVVKRDGFNQLPTSVFDPTTGLASSKTLGNMTLLTTLGKRLIAVAAMAPMVLSETAACWESPPLQTPTFQLHERNVANVSGVQFTPASARIGSRTMYVWSQQVGSTLGCYGTIVDDDGSVIRNTFTVDGPGQHVKVVADGTRFWTVDFFVAAGNKLRIAAYDINGSLLGSIAIAADASNYFDVQFDATNGVIVLQKTPAAGTADLNVVTWTGAAVNVVTNTIGAASANTGRVGFLRNDTGDGQLYWVAVNGVSPNIAYAAYQTNTTTINHAYTIATNQTILPAEIAGFVRASGAKDITVLLSFLDTTVNAQLGYANGTPQLNFTDIYTVTFAGVSTKVTTKRSLTLVSTPLLISNSYFVAMYYHSQPSVNLLTNQVQQSTFFLANIDFSSTYQTVGRWENTTAYADWQDAGTTTNYVHLSMPQVDPSGGIHLALTYRATSTTSTVVIGSGDVRFQASLPANTTGIRDYSFGPSNGQGFEFYGELMMPGPQAFGFDSALFTENGMPLIPEILNVTSTAGGNKTAGATYQYVAVAEYTDNNGNLVYSATSTPFSITGAGGNQSFDVVLTNIHVTSKLNVRLSLYCTFTLLGVQSTQHYKVTDDLNPTYNTDGSFTVTIHDALSDALTQARTILYTDKSLVDRFPAPAFHAGCAGANRAFVIGYDNALWFSAPKVEGDALWFSPAFRIPFPTTERMVAVAPLDNFIIIFGERESLYAIPVLSLPDATGTGTIPDAQLITSVTHGVVNGQAISTSSGIWFASTQGGIWQFTRNLDDTFSGAPVVADTGTVVGMATDANQRIAAINNNGKILVFDQVTACWYTWTSGGASNPQLLTSHKGAFTYFDFSGTQVVRQTAGAVSDVGVQILTTVTVSLHIAGVLNFVRIWDMVMSGEWRGDHDLTIAAFFDDIFNVTPFVYGPFTPSNVQPYIYDLPPKIEECSSITLQFQDSFPRGVSAGFGLEMIACEFGVEPGLSRLIPSTQRIPSS